MKRVLLALVMLVSMVSFAQARMVDDVNMPDTFKAGDTQLNLNGAGIRSKWFINLYVGGLYLPNTSMMPRKSLLPTSRRPSSCISFPA